MINWGEKLRKNIDLERRLKYLTMEIKISKIGFKYMNKYKSVVRERKLFMKREKMRKSYKSELIYDSKLKSNAKW